MSEELSPSYLLLSQISQFISLILSHPLYFSYFLFFSPYIFKVFSFLSPLFTTTFLLLLAFFFTFSNSHQSQDDQSTSPLPQQNEWFNTLFNTPLEIPIIPFQLEDQEPEIKKEINTSFSQVSKQEAKDDDDDDHHDHDIRENGIEMGVKNKSFLVGCKLVFEVDEEKMDLLWEKYEEKEKLVVDEKKDEKRCNLKKDLRSLVNLQKEMEEEEEEEEESGKICCLQALKFSSGKMRFGMGKKSGLKKISKAFKGLKLLNQLVNNGKNKIRNEKNNSVTTQYINNHEVNGSNHPTMKRT